MAQSGYDVFGGDAFRQRRCRGAWVAQIVDAFEDDGELHAGLGDNIALESGKRIQPEPDVGRRIMQYAVAADTGIDHRGPSDAKVIQPVGEEVRPTLIGVGGRVCAIGDGIAERYDGEGRIAGQNVDAAEKSPGRDCGGASEKLRGALVGRADIIGLHRRIVNARAACRTGEVQADREVD